jgi:hypothetical protein
MSHATALADSLHADADSSDDERRVDGRPNDDVIVFSRDGDEQLELRPVTSGSWTRYRQSMRHLAPIRPFAK